MMPFQDTMSTWMQTFIGNFALTPDSACSPRIGIVTFNGPPIGCRLSSPNAACKALVTKV